MKDAEKETLDPFQLPTNCTNHNKLRKHDVQYNKIRRNIYVKPLYVSWAPPGTPAALLNSNPVHCKTTLLPQPVSEFYYDRTRPESLVVSEYDYAKANLLGNMNELIISLVIHRASTQGVSEHQ